MKVARTDDTPPSFVLAQAIMRIIREGGPYVEAAIENECAHALRKARAGD